LLHFNNAGAALSPDQVTAAVIEHLRREQEIGPYEAAAAAADELEKFYSEMAKLLGCRAEEIAFIENATRAWDLALYAVDLQAGDEILTARNEYASNYLGLLHLARQRGLSITVIDSDDDGLIDLEALERSISPRSRLIALTHIASQRGDIQPAAEVGEIAHRHGLLYLLDACQSVGHLRLDVETLQCDFLTGTGRKYLRGPRGTGFLYVRGSILKDLNPEFVDLHAASWTTAETFNWRPGASRFEVFERFVAGQIGLARAVAYANSLGAPAIEARIRALAVRLRQRLFQIRGLRVLERSTNFSGIVTFHCEQIQAEKLQLRLRKEGVNTSVARASGARLDLDREEMQAVSRASVHYYNSETEIEGFASKLEDCLGTF